MKTMGEHLFRKASFLLVLTFVLLACQEKPCFDFDFEQPAILDKLHWKCGTLYRLSSDHATSGTNSLEVTFYPGPPGVDESYPGLSLTDFERNWSGYRTLVFDAFVPGEKAINLALRIDDRENPDYAERFNMAIPLAPGSNHIAIPQTRLVTSGSKKPLDLENIRETIFFLANPKERQTIFFDRIRLE
ncbi:MAG: hypothetical protein ACYC99_02190 [Candidatus Geothermincolia bacterium]